LVTDARADRGNQAGDQEGVAADVEARLQAQAVVGLADAPDRGDVGLVEAALEDDLPVFELGVTGVLLDLGVGEEGRGLGEAVDVPVEALENDRQLLLEPGFRGAQGGAGRRVDLGEGEPFLQEIAGHV
jgi:hypothetical protein